MVNSLHMISFHLTSVLWLVAQLQTKSMKSSSNTVHNAVDYGGRHCPPVQYSLYYVKSVSRIMYHVHKQGALYSMMNEVGNVCVTLTAK